MSQTTAAAPILTHSVGAVRVITLNRPAALNSFTAAMHALLLPALEAAATDSAVRAVIVTGTGRGFCAGQDLSDGMSNDASLQKTAPDVGALIERLYRPLAMRVRSMPIPVLAAVNGVAAGAGANFALCCDLVIAARSASFIQAFSKIGLIPDCAGTWLLPRLIGRAKAMGYAMTGEKMPAVEAERLGLIWQCVDDAALMDSALALATRLAAMSPRALAETRRTLDASSTLDFSDALTLEANAQRELGRGHDFPEGVAAFFAKRPPNFTDR